MFVFTAKLNRKKAVIGMILFALLIIAVILAVSLRRIHGNGSPSERTDPPAVHSASEAADYLRFLGWEADGEPIEVRTVIIPREFSGVYQDYAALQREQGYTLERYGGKEATRYTFRIKNYPTGESGIVADLIVCGASVIAGDLQSTASDGFMTALIPRAEANAN